jgi:hypothetical protein
VLVLMLCSPTQAAKARFSRPGVQYETDYAVDFTDAQLLHQYSQIIAKAGQTLNSTLRMIPAMSTHYSQLTRLRDTAAAAAAEATHSEFRVQLELFTEDLVMHRQSVDTLEKYADRTMSLLLELLAHRRDQRVRQAGEVIQSDGKQMQDIARSSRNDLEEARSLLQSSSKQTARMMRFGLVATLYLPATLVAVSPCRFCARCFAANDFY